MATRWALPHTAETEAAYFPVNRLTDGTLHDW
jgi:hypothetical protein